MKKWSMIGIYSIDAFKLKFFALKIATGEDFGIYHDQKPAHNRGFNEWSLEKNVLSADWSSVIIFFVYQFEASD